MMRDDCLVLADEILQAQCLQDLIYFEIAEMGVIPFDGDWSFLQCTL